MSDKKLTSEELSYPVGRFVWSGEATAESREHAIDQIATLPTRLRTVVEPLDDEQLATPYRPEGWTLLQVVHHIADAHLNGYTRFKLALTEDCPTIKPYNQDAWSELEEVTVSPAVLSLNLVDALHARWANLLCSLKNDDLAREFLHPETGSKTTLDKALAMYAWHGEHHLAQIKSLVSRKGW